MNPEQLQSIEDEILGAVVEAPDDILIDELRMRNYTVIEPVIKKTKIQKHEDNIRKIMEYLSASIIHPNGEGSMKLNFVLDDEVNRQEMKDMIMQEMRQIVKLKIKG